MQELKNNKKCHIKNLHIIELLVAENKAFESGNVKLIFETCSKINDIDPLETDKTIYLKLQCNLAISYIQNKKYNDADDLLKKIIIQIKKTNDKEFLYVLFSNYCLNKLRLTSENVVNDARNVLLEYKKYLNMNKYQDYIDFMNLETDFLRGIGASTFDIEKNINDSLIAVSKLKISKISKAFYDSTVARMVWAHRTSPELCLEMLDQDLIYIKQLPLPEKYYAFKHIDLFFKDLKGDIVSIYSELKKAAHQYMINHALYDMSAYYDSLPVSAIKERAAIQLEIISLLKNDPRKYNFELLKEKFETAINLCSENHLNILENKYRLDLIDEATNIFNFGKDGKLKYHDFVKSQLDILEKFVPSIGFDIDIAEFASRMACYYYCIQDKEMFISSCNRYKKANVNKQYFAPWLRGKILICTYISSLYIIEDFLDLQNNNDIAVYIAVARYLEIQNAELKVFIFPNNESHMLLIDFDNKVEIDIFHKKLGIDSESFLVCAEGLHVLEQPGVSASINYIDLQSIRDERILSVADKYYIQLKRNDKDVNYDCE